MALNALAALLAATEVGGSAASVLDGLAGFEGVRRRFESVGTSAGVRVFDDYAHHPTEVRATLEALRGVAGESRSIVVFQPHSTRDQDLRHEFASRCPVPTRSSCSTCTPPANLLWPGSAAPASPIT